MRAKLRDLIERTLSTVDSQWMRHVVSALALSNTSRRTGLVDKAQSRKRKFERLSAMLKMARSVDFRDRERAAGSERSGDHRENPASGAKLNAGKSREVGEPVSEVGRPTRVPLEVLRKLQPVEGVTVRNTPKARQELSALGAHRLTGIARSERLTDAYILSPAVSRRRDGRMDAERTMSEGRPSLGRRRVQQFRQLDIETRLQNRISNISSESDGYRGAEGEKSNRGFASMAERARSIYRGLSRSPLLLTASRTREVIKVLPPDALPYLSDHAAKATSARANGTKEGSTGSKTVAKPERDSSIVINHAPTLVVHQADGNPDLERRLLGLLTRNGYELAEIVRRETARRRRTRF